MRRARKLAVVAELLEDLRAGHTVIWGPQPDVDRLAQSMGVSLHLDRDPERFAVVCETCRCCVSCGVSAVEVARAGESHSREWAWTELRELVEPWYWG